MSKDEKHVKILTPKPQLKKYASDINSIKLWETMLFQSATYYNCRQALTIEATPIDAPVPPLIQALLPSDLKCNGPKISALSNEQKTAFSNALTLIYSTLEGNSALEKKAAEFGYPAFAWFFLVQRLHFPNDYQKQEYVNKFQSIRQTTKDKKLTVVELLDEIDDAASLAKSTDIQKLIQLKIALEKDSWAFKSVGEYESNKALNKQTKSYEELALFIRSQAIEKEDLVALTSSSSASSSSATTSVAPSRLNILNNQNNNRNNFRRNNRNNNNAIHGNHGNGNSTTNNSNNEHKTDNNSRNQKKRFVKQGRKRQKLDKYEFAPISSNGSASSFSGSSSSSFSSTSSTSNTSSSESCVNCKREHHLHNCNNPCRIHPNAKHKHTGSQCSVQKAALKHGNVVKIINSSQPSSSHSSSTTFASSSSSSYSSISSSSDSIEYERLSVLTSENNMNSNNEEGEMKDNTNLIDSRQVLVKERSKQVDFSIILDKEVLKDDSNHNSDEEYVISSRSDDSDEQEERKRKIPLKLNSHQRKTASSSFVSTRLSSLQYGEDDDRLTTKDPNKWNKPFANAKNSMLLLLSTSLSPIAEVSEKEEQESDNECDLSSVDITSQSSSFSLSGCLLVPPDANLTIPHSTCDLDLVSVPVGIVPPLGVLSFHTLSSVDVDLATAVSHILSPVDADLASAVSHTSSPFASDLALEAISMSSSNLVSLTVAECLSSGDLVTSTVAEPILSTGELGCYVDHKDNISSISEDQAHEPSVKTTNCLSKLLFVLALILTFPLLVILMATASNNKTTLCLPFSLTNNRILHTTTNVSDNSTIILDSGASVSIMNQLVYFRQGVKSVKETSADLADGSTIRFTLAGLATIVTPHGCLKVNAFYDPRFPVSVLSLSKLPSSGYSYEAFGIKARQQFVIYDDTETKVATTDPDKPFAILHNTSLNIIARVVFSKLQTQIENDKSSIQEFHHRLGHLNFDSLRKLCEDYGINMPFIDNYQYQCLACSEMKSTRRYASLKWHSQAPPTRPNQELVVDLKGPIYPPSVNGYKYVLVIICRFSRHVTVFAMKEKSSTCDALQNYINEVRDVQTLVSFTPSEVRSDNGGEFLSSKLSQFFKSKGIKHSLTTAYSPNSNGIAERGIRTIFETAGALLRQACLPPRLFWVDAVATAAYIRNHLPHSFHHQIPATMFKGTEVNRHFFKFLHCFGALALTHIPEESKRGITATFAPKTSRGVFVGYSVDRKAARVFDLDKRMIIESKDVTVHENVFPFASSSSLHPSLAELQREEFMFEQVQDEHKNPMEIEAKQSANQQFSSSSSLTSANSDPLPILTSNSSTFASLSTSASLPTSSSSTLDMKFSPTTTSFPTASLAPNPLVAPRTVDASTSPMKTAPSPRNTTPLPTSSTAINTNSSRPQLHRRQRTLSWNDTTAFYHSIPSGTSKSTTTIPVTTSNVTTSTGSTTATSAPSEKVLNLKSSVDEIPHNVAMSSDHKEEFIKAKAAELQQHKRLGTFIVVNASEAKSTPISSRWVLTKTTFPNQTLKFKARLVAKGFLQKEGVNYSADSLYAPTLSRLSSRILLAVAAQLAYIVSHIDINCAFLNAELKDDVYMYAPEGVSLPQGKIFKLKKALYGLRQSPREWYKDIRQYFITLKFNPLTNDQCVFANQDRTIIIGLFVDDIKILTKTSEDSHRVKKMIADKYQLKDLGILSAFVGAAVRFDSDFTACFMNQTNTINEIVADYGLAETKSRETPAPSTVTSSTKDDLDQPFDKIKFMQLLGRLNWINGASRPDPSYPINQLAKKSQNPTRRDYHNLLNVVKYLKGTADLCIEYRQQPSLTLLAFSDASYASIDSIKSVSGGVIMLSGGPIYWCSHVQDTIALSSTEAEMVAVVSLTQQVLFVRNFLSELLLKELPPTPIYTDSKPLALLTANNEGLSKTRLRYRLPKVHWLQEQVATKNITLPWIEGKSNVADTFTKNLSYQQFYTHLSALVSEG